VTRPLVLFDPWPRQRRLIFTDALWARLGALARVVGPEDRKADPAEFDPHLAEAAAVVGQTDLSAERLARMPKLRAVINVEGNFLQNVDYAACFARGIHVLGVGPAFSLPVAEAALGLAIDLARGFTTYDRRMREGTEEYGFKGNRDSFLLTGSTIGLIGFGNLGRALIELLRPFRARLLIHDPWLPDGTIRAAGAEPAALDALLGEARVIFVLAGVTAENTGFLDRARLSLIRRDAVFVLASRAAVVEFPALVELADAGAFRAATDVFPVEPVAKDDPVRRSALLLSPHRAGGIAEAMRLIGEMVVDDLELVLRGLPPVRLQEARAETVGRFRSMPSRAQEKGISL
jgi:phosphoglycerate dehydrogenase-like enzyme